jgi:outer membrane immunogenic protein
MKNSIGRALTALALGLCVAGTTPAWAQHKDKKTTPSVLQIPSASWGGVYFGVNGGGGFGRSSFTGATAATSSGDFDTSGGFFGGTVGYNYFLSPTTMIGLEGDIAWANITGTTHTNCFVGCSATIASFGTARARVGYAPYSTGLLYVTGGAAWADRHANVNGFEGISSTDIGAAFGVGWEHWFAQNISGGLEFLYLDVGKVQCTFAACGGNEDVSFKSDIIRASVRWHWTLPSDIRLKHDIALVGELPNGLHLYRFRYSWSDQLYVGVMAQEVAEVMPAALVPSPYGYLAVDYGKINAHMQTWEEFVASHPAAAAAFE